MNAGGRSVRALWLAQNGYIVGAPTYVPVGSLRCAASSAAQPVYPDALAHSANGHWQGRARLSLMFADSSAGTGDVVACVGMLAQAVLCIAHARLAQRHVWVLNEKRLVQRADGPASR